MAITTTSQLSPKVQAYYDQRFLLRAKPTLVGYQFGQKRDLPSGVGDTVFFTRYIPLAKQTSPLTEALDGGLDPATRQQIKTEEISASVDLWGDYVQLSHKSNITTIGRTMDEKVDLLAQQAAESIDFQIIQSATIGMNHRRADGDATLQVEGTADSGTTTTMVDSARTEGDDFWNGGYLAITEGTNYGEVRQVTDFDAASDTTTVGVPFTLAIDSTSLYRMVVGTGIVAGDVLSTANIRLGVRDLKRAKALKAERGYYIGLINPDVEFDFMGDTTWVTAAQYKDSVDALYEGEIGKWFGIRFVGTTEARRESVAGVESSTGAVHNALLLGREAYGVVDLAGQPKKIYTKTPDQLGQPIPVHSTIGWEVGFKEKALNGQFGVSLMCGASA